MLRRIFTLVKMRRSMFLPYKLLQIHIVFLSPNSAQFHNFPKVALIFTGKGLKEAHFRAD